MDCKEILSPSLLSGTIHEARFFWGRGARFASCAYNRVPINASSATKLGSISRRSARKILSPAEKEAQARAFEIERKFAENADKDMRTMCEEGQVKEAVEYIELLHKGRSFRLKPKSYAFLLQQCAKMRALEEGKRVHALLITCDVSMDVFVRNHLLSLYVKCGCLKEAKLMFQAMGSARDVVSWTLMINACAEYGQFFEAIKLYHTMCKRRVTPNKITYVCLLKACKQPEHLPTGKLLHEHITNRCLNSDTYVGGALVGMYFTFGEVKAAREAFYGILKTNAFLWNRLIAGYVENGKSREALRAYRHMRYRHRVEPTEATWVHVIKACGDRADLQEEAYTECEKHDEAARLKRQMQEHEKHIESGQADSVSEPKEAANGTCRTLAYEELLAESVQVDSVE
ncbi:hypothetical protein L7F22_042940 [Adiantum nelumboides]|nr:hypothetical protein [Adiantum nelumboides]